ncbi:MAG: Isopentenyl-diphosphate Delta-isomerase, partial [uncultured Nocardioidaceae bacterium]
APGRGRSLDRIGAQGERAPPGDPPAPRLLLLCLRLRRAVPADPPGRAQEDLAGRVDEQLLRSPLAGRGHRVGGAPPGSDRAGPGPSRADPRPAGLSLPGRDARRHRGERDVSGLPVNRDRSGAGRARRDRRRRLGGLGDVSGPGARRRARHQPVVRRAGRPAPADRAGPWCRLGRPATGPGHTQV